MEKSNDSEVIEFLSELEISSDSNEDATPPQIVRTGAGPFKTGNETTCGSPEEYKETYSDELLRNSFFSFISNDESSAASANHGSPFKLEFLDKRFSHIDRSDARQKALSWFSDIFACQGKMEGCLTGALVTDAEGYIIDKQSVIRESAFHSVLESISNKSRSMGKQEQICSESGRNVLGTAVDNLKEFCAVQNNEENFLEKIVAPSPSPGCYCHGKMGTCVVTDANTFNEDHIVNQAPIMLLESDMHALLGVSQAEPHIAIPPSNDLIEKTQEELSILRQAGCTVEEKLTVVEEKHCDEEMSPPPNHSFETIFVKIRLRKMEADLMKERNAKAEKQEEFDLLLERIAELESERNEAQKIISSLKSDLQVAAVSPSSVEIPSSTSAIPNGRSHNESVLPPGILHYSCEGISEPSNAQQALLETSKSTSEMSNDDHTIRTQLDQLRVRCDMLEEMRESLQQDLAAQIHKDELLKMENAELCATLNKICSDETADDDADLHLERLEEHRETVSEMGSVPKQEPQKARCKIGLIAMHIRTIFFRCIVGTLLLLLLTILQWCYDQEEQGEGYLCRNDDIGVRASECNHPMRVDELFGS